MILIEKKQVKFVIYLWIRHLNSKLPKIHAWILRKEKALILQDQIAEKKLTKWKSESYSFL